MITNEDILHFVWKTRQFNQNNLTTTNQETIRIISPGWHNHDQGPDFINAKIVIGNTIWAGNVEIHIKSSDWLHHGHQHDPNYRNVILHVVYEHDQEIEHLIGCPTLQLKGRIPRMVLQKYACLQESSNDIVCGPYLNREIRSYFSLFWDSWIIERWQRKIKEKQKFNDIIKNDWQHLFQIFLFDSFGFGIHKSNMELLGLSIPPKVLSNHKDNLLQLEAILFGMAGFLNEDAVDSYQLRLIKEFEFLKSKWKLNPPTIQWKFSRTRPANFPTIRLAQLAALYHSSQGLLSIVNNPEKIYKNIFELFSFKVSAYWQQHYHFGKKFGQNKNFQFKLSADSAGKIISNALLPFLFYYADQLNMPELKESLLTIPEKIKPEKNKITAKWLSLGVANQNQLHSQSLMELYNNYCVHKKCTSCKIGNKILSSTT